MPLPQVFNADIHNLLSMADMWRSRAPPTPLDFDAIKAGPLAEGEKAPHSPPKERSNGTNKKTRGGRKRKANGRFSGSKAPEAPEKLLNGGDKNTSKVDAAVTGLKDQRSLTLSDNLALFVSRYYPHIHKLVLANDAI
jgi:ubiquitin-like 1-activating enzyme E1 B